MILLDSTQKKRAHNVVIEEKHKISITGVKDVDSFNEEIIVALLEDGEMNIRGTNLHISKLCVETGELFIEGEINSVIYTKEMLRQGFLKKLFR